MARDNHDLEKDSQCRVDDVATLEKDEKAEGVMNGDYSGAVAKTDPKEIALVKKLDLRIMPTLFCMYFLNKLDQNAIANARLNNLEADLKLVGSEYNTCISILYVGYLFAQIPSNMLMSSNKVRPSLYMAGCMMAWAIVATLTALVKNYTDLVVVRFFLGIVEAPFYPGALYILSLFYTRKEIATRVSILYAGNIFATSFSGLIAAATFATLDNKHGMHGWQWLFIIEGVVTFGVAVVAVFLLPDHPLTTRWLTEEQRQLAHDRIQRDTVGLEASKGARAGFMQAIRDPRLYVLLFMQNMHLSATSFNQFFPTVVSSLGFNKTITLVLTCPPTLVAGAVGIGIGISSGKFNERTWHITIMMGIALVGFVISAVTLNVAARYVSCFLFASGVYAVNSVILGWVSATLGQTSEKKASSLSIINMLSMASFIYTPYLYPKSDGPKYVIAMSSNASFAFATIASAWALRVWLTVQNKRLASEGKSVFYAY
ncbi:MFS general substrate transporter [Aaosphaeria arxii CBS 175.79]|uniref:MFS general substrate transporter n=1 Tax=Aaosphaeria arxii CBS 175.79 TaxID=1450172 RepID=A0A6A5XUE6_9PLEO|nr:MFS general substrate transporter [Aaosphaeria arxii CBS 175.79]KAF2016938.1 MFS general substrate transporter [Aaosphaeria arxii CBS 175.79]